MKTETKTTTKSVAVVLAAIILLATVILMLPVKALLAIIIATQFVTIVALGDIVSENLNSHHEQKKQNA